MHQPAEDRWSGVRDAAAVTSGVLLLACLIPPVAGWARRYEAVEALQFSLLAVAVPALLVCGAPWRRGRRASGPVAGGGPVDRLARSRRSHLDVWRSSLVAVGASAAVIVWRLPPAVDGLAHHWWLASVEAVTLLAAGVGLWLELVESPPVAPRLSRPHRIGVAALSMWVIWVLAYLVGLSHNDWYDAFVHRAGSGLSLSADQQLATAAMWLVSGCAFVPVVFWNLMAWLRSEEDPDRELNLLVRFERTRGTTWDVPASVAGSFAARQVPRAADGGSVGVEGRDGPDGGSPPGRDAPAG